MSLFDHPEFDQHESVLFGFDADSGLRALIAVHSTRLGPSLGGCRMVPYPDDNAALTDVLRLSRGMSYKAALADLPQGGGKSVILGDPRAHKSDALMRAMGRLVERAAGRYIVAEDSGISVADVVRMSEETTHVAGVPVPGTPVDGDPSPATARGVWMALRAAWQRLDGRDGPAGAELRGVGVAVQGCGKVGARLVQYLVDAGARVWICDAHAPTAEACAAATGAEIVAPEAIYDVPADIFAPCALGAVLNARTIPRLRARLVVGAANNQLATAEDDDRLRAAGVVYAPDYVVNAGGIIDIHYQRQPRYDPDTMQAHLARIPEVLVRILDTADAEARGPAAVADAMARDRIAGAAV
ncbi:MAG: Glu/Leu/Phe/Val family dehydrogenase [Algiphilus sp.]